MSRLRPTFLLGNSFRAIRSATVLGERPRSRAAPAMLTAKTSCAVLFMRSFSALRSSAHDCRIDQLAYFGTSYRGDMGKRGPKPVDVGLLTFWEFEFYKSFHLLRDGTQLPQSAPTLPRGLSRTEMQGFVRRLKQMSAQEYWLTDRRLLVKVCQKANMAKPPTTFEMQWAEGL